MSAKLKLRVGFLVGKTDSLDRSPPSCRPASLPEKYRGHGAERSPWADEDDQDSEDAMFIVDRTVGCRMMEMFPDEFEVDWILLDEISTERLSQNDINFTVGIDLVTAWAVSHPLHGPDHNILGDTVISKDGFAKVMETFKAPESKLFPDFEFQHWILRKDIYMAELKEAGVPILDTIYVDCASLDCKQLLDDITQRGWSKFCIKPFPSSWSAGFEKFDSAAVVADPGLLSNHFEHFREVFERYMIQEFIESPEVVGKPFYEYRIYWLNGEYMCAVGTHYGMPEHDPDQWLRKRPAWAHNYSYPVPEHLERAKDIGREAVRVAQQHSSFQGKPTKLSLIRTDIGITHMQVRGLEHKDGLCMFLNEYEIQQADWHQRIFQNDPDLMGGVKFEGFEGFSMLDRMAEYFGKKSRELCRGGPVAEVSFKPQ